VVKPPILTGWPMQVIRRIARRLKKRRIALTCVHGRHAERGKSRRENRRLHENYHYTARKNRLRQ
jgi:hypothetical protein